MQTVKINEQFTRMRNILNKDIENPHQFEWIGFAKIISIWTFAEKNDIEATDYYRYLPSNELKNFIRRGYYPYIKQIEENLTLFYLYCDDFSIKEQNIEKIIRDEFTSTNLISQSSDVKNTYIENKIIEIQVLSESYRPAIFQKYNDIHSFFKKNIFWIIILYLSENLLIKTLRKGAMNLNRSSIYQTLIHPNRWIIVSLIAAIIFYLGIQGTIWWSGIDSGNIFYQEILLHVFSYAFVAVVVIALPLLIIYRIVNQEWRFGIRLAATAIFLFFLMIISFGIVSTFFPNAPQFMRDGTTSFIAAVIGGVIALILENMLRPRS